MLFFYYGIADFYTNVTFSVRTKCTEGNEIVIPPCDSTRASLFGDPMRGLPKQLCIVDNTGSTVTLYPNFSARIPLNASSISDVVWIDHNAERAKWWREEGVKLETPELKLQGLHERTEIVFGKKNDEIPEQLFAIQYIKPTDTVLEIGGNIGRNSCTIAQLLDDDSRLVVLESFPRYAFQANVNRFINGYNFNVESSALSLMPLTQHGWETRQTLEGGEVVNTITWSELQTLYPHLKFNVLVIDCEGAFFSIVRDFPDILNGIETVIIENDFPSKVQKEFVDSAFRANGLVPVVTQSTDLWYAPGGCKDQFYQVWVKSQE